MKFSHRIPGLVRVPNLPNFPGGVSLSAMVAAIIASGTAAVWLDPSDLTTLFQDTAGTVPVTGIGGETRAIHDKTENGNNATSATAWLLRRDEYYSLERVGGTFSVTLPDLGTDATVAYVDDLGVTILTAQTISGAYNLPTSARLGSVVIIDRALTDAETALLTAWLNARRPGDWLLGLGAWDDNGVWDDRSIWQTAA